MYKAFISYSWKKLDERRLVAGAIKDIPDMDAVIDEETVDYGDENLWLKILDALGESDLIIALLSEESISSSAVIDELARANDRGISILPILTSGFDPNDSRIPYYLRLAKYLEYDSINPGEFITNLKLAVEEKIKSGSNRSSKSFSKLRNSIVENERTLVSDMILSEVVEQTRLEANEINTGTYEINLGMEYDFLKRAEPLFGSAKTIYATTVSSVSSFWTDKVNKEPAIKYLLAQKGKVIRIFVFDKPDALVRYSEILDANYEQYGKNGAVFVTSREFYINNIVGGFCTNEESKKKLLGIDFGVLEYESSTKLFAWLRKQYLGFKDAEIQHTEYQVNSENVALLFNKINSECGDGFNEKYGVIRWGKDKSTDKDFLKLCVDDLFGPMLGDLSHLVLFRDTNNRLSSTIARVKHNISILVDEYGDEPNLQCSDVWFGQNLSIDARDKTYGGELIHNQDYKYLLYMRLPTKQDLEYWYQLDRHSELRKQLYCKLVDSVTDLYSEMDKLIESGEAIKAEAKQEVSDLYRKVEEKLKNELVRLDYQYIESPESLVEMAPYPFMKDYLMQKDLLEL